LGWAKTDDLAGFTKNPLEKPAIRKMLLPKLYKISILYNFDELNDPTGRRAPVPAFTTFLTKSLTSATTCVKMVTAERT